MGENVAPGNVGTRDVGINVGMPVVGALVGLVVGLTVLGAKLVGTADVGTAVGENV